MSAIDQVPDEKARAVLRRLHGEASREYVKLFWKYLPYWIPMFRGKKLPWDRLERRHDGDYMATTPGGGMYCYLLARALGARRIVEFGTSFGVSTIWLALAVRDNGGGTVIGTEYIPTKAAKARSNIAEAGLADFVDVRVGNAVDTLRDLEAPVDFMSSDGFPQYALPVLQLVAPKMRRGRNRGHSQRRGHEGRPRRVFGVCPQSGQRLCFERYHPGRRVVRTRDRAVNIGSPLRSVLRRTA